MTTADLDNLRKLADDMHSRAVLAHAAMHAAADEIERLRAAPALTISDHARTILEMAGDEALTAACLALQEAWDAHPGTGLPRRGAAAAAFLRSLADAASPAPSTPRTGPHLPLDTSAGFASAGAEGRWISDCDAGVYDEGSDDA